MLSAERKVQGSHLERLAMVYLRQSSAAQVRFNVRSTERQYALAEEAAKLGWEAERIVVIDGDLGISGRDTHAREGYKELVARVCLGEVGAIFGLEISRLARSNADLQRLLEFCGLTDTLVVDTDGIYDLHDFNDRLLLGLKAQMSEAELHIITSRLQGAKRAAAQRGELRFPLPVGYVHDDDGQTIIDPDEEVRAAIADLFCAFEQTGSAYGVVGVFKGRRFPKRAYGGAWAGALRWGASDASARVGRAREPVLRRGVCVRALSLAARGPPGRLDLQQGRRAAARRVGGPDPGSPRGLHHLGDVSRQREEAAGERHAPWSAPAARRPGVVSRDRPLWRVRSVDDDASPRRGQLLRMRSLARGPHQHAWLPVGQDGRR